jgi:phage tail sheath gpL-like
MSIVITGFSPSDKRPMVFRETKFGQGRPTVGSAPMRVLLVGTKATSGGTLVNDTGPVQCFGEDDALAKCGTHNELVYMAYAALQIPGVELWLAAVAPAGGAAAAALTILVGGTASNGTIRGRVAGIPWSIGVSSTDAVATIATNIQLAIASLDKAPVTATIATATVTVTAGFTGVRGNDILLWLDSSECSALTLTVTGGTPLHTGSPSLTPLTGGVGADVLTTTLGLMDDAEYHFPVFAQYDVTNAALIKAYLANVALPGTSFLQHAYIGIPDDYAAALALAATTLNDYRSRVLWQQNCETLPCAIAAVAAALAASIVPQNPNYKWANVPLPGIAPQSYPADRPGSATQIACLNNGITPVLTLRDGSVVIQRGIISHCLYGTSPDYRALDWADTDVPDRISRELDASWTAHAEANPVASEDPGANDPQPAAGHTNPSRWNVELMRLLRRAESSDWIVNVSDNLPVVEWDNDRKCIVCAVPHEVCPKSFQLGASIRQIGR